MTQPDDVTDLNFAKLTEIGTNARAELTVTTTLANLESIKTKYLGKAGIITACFQQFRSSGTLTSEQKKEFGSTINLLKDQFTTLLEERKQLILKQELEAALATETVDVTLPGRGQPIGSLHPVTLAQNRMLNIFTKLGFNITDGPEIETDYYNFQALNIPDNHPARAMQDTFYTANNTHVLRTHTSPLQIRFAKHNTPPIKVIAPGRVYRIDMDRTHSPMFHQLEGLWIDKDINFANLKWIIIEFLRQFFADDTLEVRFRASFFPFTEPSAEVDIKDKEGRWLEVAGCGMVHPQVLKNMHIDANIYRGFAFGLGIDRFTMLRYAINDLRLLFANDLDFLCQFESAASS